MMYRFSSRVTAMVLALILLLTVGAPAVTAAQDDVYTSELVKNDIYRVYVIDASGTAISGAEVTWTNRGKTTTKSTNAWGYVDFTAQKFYSPSLKVEKSGYTTWTNEYTGWEVSPLRLETVMLFPSDGSTLRLRSAIYNNEKDLLYELAKLNLGSDATVLDTSDGPFTLDCSTMDMSATDKLQLYQGTTKIAESATGHFDLNTASFKKGGNVFIKAIGKNGSNYSTKIKLEFYKIQVTKNVISLNMGQLSFGVPDSVPFVGGSKFDIDLPMTIPLTFAVSEDKFSIGFGINANGAEKERIEKMKKTQKLMQDLFKSGIKPGTLTDAQQREFSSLVNGGSSMSDACKFMKNCRIDVLGYADCKLSDIDGGIKSVTGNLMLRCSIDVFNFSWSTWCVIVPVTVNIKISGGLNSAISISYDFDTEALKGSFAINPYLSLDVFGGVGVGKVAAVGAYGKATIESNIDVLPDPAIRDVSLTGELGLKAYVFFLTYTKSFVKNTWYLYQNSSLSSKDAGGTSYQEALSGLNDASQYKTASLSYLADEGTWIGDTDQLQARDSLEDAEMSFTQLLTGTYRNAKPVMISSGSKLYAAFIHAQDATEQNPSPRVYTVVTCWDGTRWSALKETELNGSMADSPRLTKSGDTIYLSYLRMPSDMTIDSVTQLGTESDQLLAYAQSQELVVGRLDPDTLTFTVQGVYASTGYLHSYDICAGDSGVTLAWLDSTLTDANSVLRPEASAVVTAQLSDGNWSAPQTVTTIEGYVENLTVGSSEGETLFAYTMPNEDPDAAPGDETSSLYTLTASGTSECVSTDCTGRVSFGRLPGAEADTFLWNEENALMSSDKTVIPAANISSNYTIMGDSIYYADSDGNLTRVRLVDGGWTGSVALISDSSYLENLSIVELNGSVYAMGMNTSVTILGEGDESEVEDSKTLVFTRVREVSDLKLDQLSYDADSLVAGEDAPIDIYVNNEGDHTVTSVQVYVNDQLRDTYQTSIAPGSYTTLQLPMTCPDTQTTYRIEVRETGMTQHTRDLNIGELTLGYCNFAISLQTYRMGNRTYLIPLMCNIGVSDGTGNLTVKSVEGTKETVICSEDVELWSGELSYMTIPTSEIKHTGDSVKIIAELSCDVDDLDYSDNTSTLILSFAARDYVSYDETLRLPAGLTSVESEAFAGDAISAVEVNEGCLTIGSRAFADCVLLKQIRLPNSVTSIAVDAFEDSEDVVLWCGYGSYAAEYAEENSMQYEFY